LIIGTGGAAWDELPGNTLKHRLSKTATLKMKRKGILMLFMMPPNEHYSIVSMGWMIEQE
jgi:hypothetical protein